MNDRDALINSYAPNNPGHRARFKQLLANAEAAAVAKARREDAARLLDESRQHAGRALFCDGIRHGAGRLKEWADEAGEAR